MPKSIFDGYLTDHCSNCPFWSDGTNPKLFGYGCAVPYPIDCCPYFHAMMEEEERGGDK